MEERTHRVLAEVAGLADDSPGAVFAVAIALEDALPITLADEDITEAALGNPAAIHATVSRYLGEA